MTLTPAEIVRLELEASRARGAPFREAWDAALQSLPVVQKDAIGFRDAENWTVALRWARPHFRRAYLGEEQRSSERAAEQLAPA